MVQAMGECRLELSSDSDSFLMKNKKKKIVCATFWKVVPIYCQAVQSLSDFLQPTCALTRQIHRRVTVWFQNYHLSLELRPRRMIFVTQHRESQSSNYTFICTSKHTHIKDRCLHSGHFWYCCWGASICLWIVFESTVKLLYTWPQGECKFVLSYGSAI